MAKIKLADVAAHAGVSKSTVSQFLNGRFKYMSEQTRRRIEESISELNYIPNAIARSLKTNTTQTIGVIVRDVVGSYTSQAIQGIYDLCKENQQNVLIYSTGFDPEKESQALKNLTQINVDGIIIASSGANADLINKLIDEGLPIVNFQLEHDGSEKYIILSDYKRYAYEATEYLLRLGHTSICFITQEFETTKSRKDRYEGYREALDSFNIPFDESLILYWKREVGFDRAPQEMLAEIGAPTAFFSQHLSITIDLLKIFNQHNINIGSDVSLISFDDLPMVEFFKTPITAIKQEPYAIGEEAAKLLLSLTRGEDLNPKKIIKPCTIIPRQSCKDIT